MAKKSVEDPQDELSGDAQEAQEAQDAADKKAKKQKLAEEAMAEYPPSAESLRAWMDVNNLSNKAVAKALRLSDGRVVRFWTSKKKPRAIPYPSWYTLKHKFSDDS